MEFVITQKHVTHLLKTDKTGWLNLVLVFINLICIKVHLKWEAVILTNLGHIRGHTVNYWTIHAKKIIRKAHFFIWYCFLH